MKSIFLPIICLFLFTGLSCSKTHKAPPVECLTFEIIDDHRIINERIEQAKDPSSIESATLDNSILSIGVSYSGGCREHCFKLLGSSAIVESYPPQAHFYLTHDADGDLCKALLTQNLRFDISSFLPFDGKIYIIQDQQRVGIE